MESLKGQAGQGAPCESASGQGAPCKPAPCESAPGKSAPGSSMKGQLTLRSIVIGCIGCVVITAASLYTALKMGALPWPIVFAALISLFFLRALGSRSLNEANVTHTIMSAGAMVAGGLAFTIPGIWMLGLGDVSLVQMILIALAGVLLGLVACGYLRRRFIEEEALEFPMGQAAAETLYAGNTGGKTGAKLFGAMGFAGVFAALRDAAGAIPSMILGNLAVPGITFGIYLSPMMLAVGFLVGTGAMIAWFSGALGQVLIVTGGSAAGLFSVAEGQSINSCLGMGLMVGFGIAVVVKDILLRGARGRMGRGPSAGVGRSSSVGAGRNAGTGRSAGAGRNAGVGTSPASSPCASNAAGAAAGAKAQSSKEKLTAGIFALAAAVIACALCLILGIGPASSVLVVLFSFVTVAMAAQSVGQTGIDPMEIFGLIVLLICAALGDTPQVQLFFVAAVIAIACGLGGDVMNDFKAGHIIGTSSKAQLIGQAIGGILGAFVSALALYALAQNYGTGAFGTGQLFVSAQASVVANLVGGISCLPAFLVGIAAGFIIHCAGGPAMMIGLGIYLPFYLSLSAFLGCLAKFAYDAITKARRASLPANEQEKRKEQAEQTGLVIASGLLGGESIVGVCIAILSLAGI